MENSNGAGAPDTRPTPEEAAAALRQADSDRTAMERLPVPGWYYPILAGLIAGVMLAQLLPSPFSFAGSLAAAVGVGALARVYVDKVGVLSWLTPRQMWPPVVLILLFLFGALVVDQVYDQQWGWVVGAAANAAVLIVFGALYRRSTGERT